MKRIFSKFCTAVICAAFAFYLAAAGARAEDTQIYQVASDAAGTRWSMAILVKSGGEVYAFTAHGGDRTGDVNYLNDLNNEKVYEMACVESVTDISVWQVSNYDGPSALTAAAPQQNQAVSVFYINNDNKIAKAERTIADAGKVFDDGTALVVLNSAISDMTSAIGPGFVVNSDSRCVGIICGEQQVVYVPWFDENAFAGGGGGSSGGGGGGGGGGSTGGGGSSGGGSSGGGSSSGGGAGLAGITESPWFPLILIAGAGVGAGLFLKNKKGQPGGVNDVPQNPAAGQFIPYESLGETEPLPGPPNIPLGETQPVVPDIGGSLFLVCTGGYMDGRVYPINADMILMGRDTSCAIKYPADYSGVSRQHAILRRQNGALTLMDTSSTGTYLKRISGKIAPKQPVPVDVGDVFYLGERKNRFEIVRR